MDYLPESDAPETVARKHVGRLRALYRLPNQAVLCEGEVTALSRGGRYVQFAGRHWLPNTAGVVLAVLDPSETKPSKRKSPYS